MTCLQVLMVISTIADSHLTVSVEELSDGTSCTITIRNSMVSAIGSKTRGSRVILSIVCRVEAWADTVPLCARVEIFSDVVNELLTLQLHLERLGRVRHNEGIRRGRLLHISGSDFCPFNVKGIRRSSGSQAHRSRAERMRSCMKRRRSSRTNGYLLRRRYRAGYTTQPLFWFWQTSCRRKWLHLLNRETHEMTT